MGLQLIFVVESNKQCKSDWIYIKDTIEHFYQYDQSQTKLSPVYMDGKGKYKNKEKEISKLVSQYAATKGNRSVVLYCFDCDDYDIKQEDSDFLKKSQQHCKEHGYEFIWFCKDIERVYLGKKVNDNDKKKESELFKARKRIHTVDAGKLLADVYHMNTSNILRILDKYFQRK